MDEGEAIPDEELRLMRRVAGLVADSGFEHVITMGKQARVFSGEAMSEKHSVPVPEAVTGGAYKSYTFWEGGEKTMFDTLSHPTVWLPSFVGSELAFEYAGRADELCVKLRGAVPLKEGHSCAAWVKARKYQGRLI